MREQERRPATFETLPISTVIGKDSLARRAPDAGALDRRLILLGSCIDSVSQADPVSMTQLMKGLDEFLERDQDRAWRS